MLIVQRISILLIIAYGCLFWGCKGFQHTDSMVSENTSLMEIIFSYKEVNTLVQRYFGKNLCYSVVPATNETKFAFYSSEINLQNRIRNRNYSECDNPGLVVFLFEEDIYTYYLQIYYTDEQIYGINKYPLLANTSSLLFKVRLNHNKEVEEMKYTSIIVDY